MLPIIISKQNVKMDSHRIMEEWLGNQGLCHVVNHISRFLDAKSLAQCRLVSHSWRDLIDNDRPWWIFQLELIQTKEKTFVAYDEDNNKKPLTTTIMARFPRWIVFSEEFSRKQRIARLKIMVNEMWTYFKDEKVECECPLLYAVKSSNTNFVQLLIDCNIDLKIKCDHDMNPMHYACKFGNFEMVQMLIKHFESFEPTSVSSYGQTIFHMAAQQPDHRVPKLILDTFKFETIRDNSGGTIIHYAVVFGPKETIQFLLESHQKIGFNLEARTEVGDTILHLACEYRDIEIVDFVFNALEAINSDIDFDTTQNDNGEFPLHCACVNKDSDVAMQLFERFPQKINTLDHIGCNWLHHACWFGHLKLIKWIAENPIGKNIDFNASSQTGKTPIHYACLQGEIEVVKFLLEISKEKGIDVEKKTANQSTPKDLAKRKGHQDIVELLDRWLWDN